MTARRSLVDGGFASGNPRARTTNGSGGDEDMAELPAAAVKRLLVKHGGGLRTSGPAVELAVAAAEEYIARLAQESGNSAAREKRKTIMDDDIKKARQVVG